jgi:protein SCO1/2
MRIREVTLLGAVAMFAAGSAPPQEQHHGSTAASPITPTGDAAPTRIERGYRMPEVRLLDQDGRPVDLHKELQRDGPVLLDFIFTTCPGICPILSATFARTTELLGDDIGRTRLWSISLDPDFDTPERLTRYGAQYHAPRQWRFFTGQPSAVRTIQKAFDADSDNKMAHRSLVLLRSKDDLWIRFEGQIRPDRLAAEVRANLSSVR